jgi:antitoxin HigA-1
MCLFECFSTFTATRRDVATGTATTLQGAEPTALARARLRTLIRSEGLVLAARKLKLAHPGKILREEFMKPVGLSAYALAKALDVPLPRVNNIVLEKRAISPEMAVLLSVYFGTADGYWINLQAHYDLEIARDRVGKHAARINPHPHDESGTLLPA